MGEPTERCSTAPALFLATPPRRDYAPRVRRLLTLLTIILIPLASVACKRQGDPLARFALSVVDAARSPSGIGPELVDADLVERIRRILLVKRTTLDTWNEKALLDALAGDAGPDRQYPVAERPQKQRERASHALASTLVGDCHAERYDAAARGRVNYLLDSMQGRLPDAVKQAQGELERRLVGAEAVRVTCERGEMVLLVAPGDDGRRKLVDVFTVRPVGANAAIEMNPSDPSLK